MEHAEQGFLLRRADSGEHFLLLVCFLRETGLIQLLARKRQKPPSGIIIPDLYDRGQVLWEQKNPSKPAILKDFEPERHHEGIARNYRALKASARLSRFYERNLLHMETFGDAWDVLSKSLDALASGSYPEVVLIKALFLVARSEGYSVSSGWLRQLPPDIRQSVKETLLSPADAVSADPSSVDDWTRRLLTFFSQETDLLPPD